MANGANLYPILHRQLLREIVAMCRAAPRCRPAGAHGGGPRKAPWHSLASSISVRQAKSGLFGRVFYRKKSGNSTANYCFLSSAGANSRRHRGWFRREPTCASQPERGFAFSFLPPGIGH